MDAATLQRWISEIAKPLGFRRKGKIDWFKLTSECGLGLFFQTATPCHYLHLTVTLRALKPELTFETYDRWDRHLFKRADFELGSLMDLSKNMSDSARESALKNKLALDLLPELESLGTINAIKEHLNNNNPRRYVPSTSPELGRLVGLPRTRPQFGYGGEALFFGASKDTHPSEFIKGPEQCTAFQLYRRNNDTGEECILDTVFTFEEAEAWFKNWYQSITREEAADLVHRFITDNSEVYEFVHFLNEPLEHDHLLQQVRREIATICMAQQGNARSSRFFSEEGIRRLRELEELLRANGGS